MTFKDLISLFPSVNSSLLWCASDCELVLLFEFFTILISIHSETAKQHFENNFVAG